MNLQSPLGLFDKGHRNDVADEAGDAPRNEGYADPRQLAPPALGEGLARNVKCTCEIVNPPQRFAAGTTRPVQDIASSHGAHQRLSASGIKKKVRSWPPRSEGRPVR